MVLGVTKCGAGSDKMRLNVTMRQLRAMGHRKVRRSAMLLIHKNDFLRDNRSDNPCDNFTENL